MNQPDYNIFDYIRSVSAVITFFIIFLIATPIILLLLIISLGHASNFIVESMAPLMIKPVMWVSGISFDIQRHTDEITSPAVFIINHSSTLDVLTILALGLPRIRFVAKWEFQYNPISLPLGRLTGQIFIKREKSEESIARLRKTYRRIRKQELSVLMAPEGSRKHPGIIGPFKKGPFRMAMDLGYPVVPIYFEGNRELNKGDTFITKSGNLTAHIHEPVNVSCWKLENLEEHIIEVRRQYIKWTDVEEDDVKSIA
jgi:1-acyl-sn-glycerol-3-phosphate acyltransferase